MGENHNAPVPTAGYGVVCIMASIAYYILVRAIVAADGADSPVAVAVGKDFKGKISTALYLCAVPLAFVNDVIADALYVGVALIWLIPDRRIEGRIA